MVAYVCLKGFVRMNHNFSSLYIIICIWFALYYNSNVTCIQDYGYN